MDLSCCILAFPLLCVLTLIMVLLHKISSPGPVFFRQERIGHRGTRFMCYKFRTMIVGADMKSHQTYCDNLLRSNAPMVKLDVRGDSRLVPGAWILRASGLDELPQIINVFQKDMSIVGPRPCMHYEFEKYLPWQKQRFNAMPGLTGLWQVSGKNRTTFDEMIRLDIRYSESTSLWLDLKIIFLTVPALLIQMGDTRRARKSREARAEVVPSVTNTQTVPKRARQPVTS